MKFKSLEIKNIASIEYSKIDFENSVLANESLFLIYGKTGSGKTTILDSICLTLYKTSPRLKQSSKEKYLDNMLITSKNDEIFTDDIRQYLRRGTMDGFAELVFEGNDQQIYTARIEFRVSDRSKRLQDAQWSIAYADQLFTKDTDVKNVVARVVGLDFEQFCRTTMLAQGEFSKFLKSTAKDKTTILEKITGTNIYSRIGQKIFTETKTKRETFEWLEKELSMFLLLSQEEIDNLNAEQEQLTQQVAKIVTDKNTLENKKNWLEKSRESENNLRAAEERYQLCANKASTNEFVQNQKLVAEYEATAEVRNDIRNANELKKELDEDNETEKKYAEAFVRITNGDLYRKQLLQQKENIIAELDNFIEQQSAKKPMYDECQTIVAKLDVVGEEKRDITNNKANVNKTTTQVLPKLENDKKELLAELEIEQKNLQDITQQKDSKQVELEKMNASQLHAKSKENSQTIIEINKAIDTVKNCHRAKQNVDVLAAKLQQTNKAITQKTNEATKAQEQLANAQKDYNEAEKTYNSVKESVGDYAKTLRAGLNIGDACPVCGQKIVALESDENLEKALKPLADNLQIKKQNLDTIITTEQTAKAYIISLNEQLQTTNTEKSKADNEYKQFLDQQETACKNLNVENNDNCLSTLQQKITDCKIFEKQLTDQLNQANNLQNEVKELDKKRETIALKIEKLNAKASKIEVEITTHRTEIDNLNNNIIKSEKKIEEIYTTLDSVIVYPNWKNDIESTITKLKAETKEYQTKTEESQKLKTEVAEEIRNIEKSAINRKKIEELHPQWKAGNAPKLMENIDANWEKFLSNCNNLETRVKMRTNMLNTHQAKIDDFIKTSQISKEQLDKLLSVSDKVIDEIKQYIELINNELNQSKGAVEQAKNNNKAIELQKPTFADNETHETIVDALNNLNQELDAANQRIGNISNQLKTDNDNKKNWKAKELMYNKAKKEFQKWDKLNKLFGDADGKKFRTIAQSYILKELLIKANSYLNELSDRYELDCQSNSLTILVRDMYMGGNLRPVDMISGGESFVVSLALALGLSSLGTNGFSTDILFIDEGFGTLDSHTLEIVMNTLEKLHKIGNRKVGIISHVDTLYERIPVKVCVEKSGNNTGKVVLRHG